MSAGGKGGDSDGMNTNDDSEDANPKPLTTAHKIEIWKFAIETQKHFAELSLRMRQLSLAVTGAIIAFASLLYARGDHFPIQLAGIDIPIAALLLLVAAALLALAQGLDASVYHHMLRGAVRFNELWEKRLREDAHWEVGLTETISAYSRYDKPQLEDGKWSPAPSTRASSAERRIRRFYSIPAIGLLIISIVIIWSYQSASNGDELHPQTVSTEDQTG